MATILIIENDLNQQLWIEEELVNEGYGVLTTASGRESLALVRDMQVDLVVLDIHMPDMDGLDVLNHLLGINPQLPIIIHTAYPAYCERFMSWAADAYIVKSSDTSELKREIIAALRRRSEDGCFFTIDREVTVEPGFAGVRESVS